MKNLARSILVLSLALSALGCSSSDDPCADHGGTCQVGPGSAGTCAGPINETWCQHGTAPAGGYCCLPCGSDAGTSDGGTCAVAH